MAFVYSICNRFLGYLDDATELFERLLHYRNIEPLVRLAPIDHVVQQLALQCSKPDHLRNLLLAVARVMLLSHAGSWSFVRAVLSGWHSREDAVADALLQLAIDAEKPIEPQGHDEPDATAPQCCFAALTVELLRLTGVGDEDAEAHDFSAAPIAVEDIYGAVHGGRTFHKTGLGPGPGGLAAPPGRSTAAAAGDGERLGHTVSGAARRVLRRLEAAAQARHPAALALLARAVSGRLYPLDPGLACSWALEQVRACCSSQPSNTSTTPHLDGLVGGRQRPLHPPPPPAPAWSLAAAAGCVPYLVAMLGLPLMLRTAEDELRRRGEDWANCAKHQGVGASVRTGVAIDADAADKPVSVLLATVAALGGEAAEAVWGMLGRVVAEALGGSGGSGGAVGSGMAGGAEAAAVAAAVLAVAESVASVGSSSRLAPDGISGVGATSAAGSGTGTGAGGVDAGASRLEALVRPLLLLSGTADAAGHQRRPDVATAAVSAVQTRVKRASLHLILLAYERALQSACGATATAVVGSSVHQQQQQQQLAHRHHLERTLQQARSRAQYLAREAGGGGLAAGAAAAAAGSGPAAAWATGRGGNLALAMEYLTEYARVGREHLKRMASPLFKGTWQRDVKPVLLRPTLDEDSARLRYSYLKEASEGFRLLSVSEVDSWAELHRSMGLGLKGPRVGDGAVVGAAGGGGEKGSAPRRPVDDLLRRLAAVGPSLATNSKTLDAVMGALEAALADELRPPPPPPAVSPPTAAPWPQQPQPRADGDMSQHLRPQQHRPQQQHQQSGGGGERGPGDAAEAEAVAAHVAELVLQAFVAAEELELEAASAASAPASATAATAAASCPAPVVPRRQSHLAWQLRLLDVMTRWPQLHAPLGRRLLQLTTDPRLAAALDERQVAGVAAALAAMSCVCAGRDGGGAAVAAVTPRYTWHLPARGRPQAAAVTQVSGPALAQAVLGSLLLGPGSQQLRFSATCLAAFLRQCSLLDGWVLYDNADAEADDGGRGPGSRRAAAPWSPTPTAAAAVADAWPAPIAVWAPPPPRAEAAAAAAGGERRRRTLGCVPRVALRSFVWIHRLAEAFGATAESGNGDDDDGSGCWSDVRQLCSAFAASPLGASMLQSGAATASGWAAVAGSVEAARAAAAGADADAAWWQPEEAGMLRLTRRALEQGLRLPVQLLEGQAALLLRHLAAAPRRPGGDGVAAPGRKSALRPVAKGPLAEEHEREGQERPEDWCGPAAAADKEGLAGGGAAAHGGWPGAKRVRVL